jgi:hypothetical protein
MSFYQGTDYYTHLEQEVFFCRQAFAAYLLRNVDHVVEIGAYRTSVEPFLKPCQTCVTIDPDLPEGDGVTRVKSTLRGCRLDLDGQNYGIALLGLELLDMDRPAWQRLFGLIDGSGTTVIEVSNYETSRRQFRQIRRNVKKTMVWQVLMDLANNGLETEFTRRRIYCLR